MKTTTFLFKIIITFFLLTSNVFASKSNHFDKGKQLFDKKEYEKSKIFFQRDIVFNPRSEKSYLYLAKIYNENDNDYEQETNLLSVLLLNPKNEEAVYMLTILKIKLSDYNEAKRLMEKFNLVCKDFCSKKAEMKKKFDKLDPKNAKDNN